MAGWQQATVFATFGIPNSNIQKLQQCAKLCQWRFIYITFCSGVMRPAHVFDITDTHIAVSLTRSTNLGVRRKKMFHDESLFQSALRAQVPYLDGYKHIETTHSLCNPKRHRFLCDAMNMRRPITYLRFFELCTYVGNRLIIYWYLRLKSTVKYGLLVKFYCTCHRCDVPMFYFSFTVTLFIDWVWSYARGISKFYALYVLTYMLCSSKKSRAVLCLHSVRLLYYR